MGHQSAEGGIAQIAESGHRGSRNAVLKNLQKLRIGELPDVGTSDDIRSAFAPFAVETMATGAIRSEGLLRRGVAVGFRQGVGSRGVLSRTSHREEQAEECAEERRSPAAV